MARAAVGAVAFFHRGPVCLWGRARAVQPSHHRHHHAADAASTGASRRRGSMASAAPSTQQQQQYFPQRYRGKVVLVTGGAVGIGAAICRRFHQEGAKVWVADIDGDGAERTAQVLEEEAKAAAAAAGQKAEAGGPRATAYKVDLTQEAQVAALVDAIVARDGRLDVLVNNAARFVLKAAEAASNEDWDTALSTNVKGYGLCIKYAVRAMRASPGGAPQGNASGSRPGGFAIVNLGSISSFIGQAGLCTYSATKAAILALTRCTAIDCGPYGIRVNAICPGPILTDATQRHADSQGKTVGDMVQEMTDHMVQHRMGDPSEVAAAVAFMASEDASFITGASLMVDGGYTAI